MPTESPWLIETKDYEGTPVFLARETWETKTVDHPEIGDYLGDVEKTIQTPDLVFASTRDERARVFYRLYVGRGILKDKHLVVVVNMSKRNKKNAGLSAQCI